LLTGSLAAALAVGSIIPAFAPAAGAQEVATAFTTLTAAPEDAVAYFNVPLDEASEQWALAQELLERAGLADVLAQAQADAGLEDVPLDSLFGGEAGIVLTAAVVENAVEAGGAAGALVGEGDEEAGGDAAAAGEAQGFGMALDARAPDTAALVMVSAVESQAEEAGAAVEESEYAGVTITAAPPAPGSDDGADDGGESMGLATARVDDLVLVATTAADLEPLIDAAQGTVGTLADVPAFAEVESALPADFLLFGFINGAAVAAQQAGTGDLAAAGLPAELGSFGPVGRSSGFTIAADQPGFRMETVAVGSDENPLAAGEPNFESGLLERTPADALFFLGASNLAATRIIDTLGAAGIALALGGFSEGGSGVETPVADQSLDEFVDAQFESLAGLLGINLQADLLQQLTGEYGLWIRSGADPSTIAALFASGVDDAATVANALAQINLLAQGAGGGESFVTTRSVGDGTVSTIAFDPSSPAIEYGAVDGELLLGVGDAVDVHTTDAASGLAGNAQFQEVMATLPEERNGTLYVDLGQVIPLLQALSQAGGLETGGLDPVPDADPACGDYATAEDAQAAYDNFEAGTENLDADFDGQVCEDFFAPAATEEAAAETDAAADAFAAFDASAIVAFALAAYDEDGNRRSSSIVYIAE
jgi:hypothetical protein